MEHHFSPFGELINRLLGPLVLPLLEAVGVHPHDTARPIPDHIATMVLIGLLFVVFGLWFRNKVSAERPTAMQLVIEQILSNDVRVGVYDLLDSIVGHHGRKYLAVVGTVGLFVLACNAISLVPAFASPTANHTVPLGCAAFVFLYYNLEGASVHGLLGYLKHFIGPALSAPVAMWPVMIPLLFVIEVISNVARLLSLTVRLWVNMVVSELLYLTFLGLGVLMVVGGWHINKGLGVAAGIIPLVIPTPFVALHIFVAVLQAFVFTLLPIVYIGGAVAEEH
ncbi:MAG TPA: FoF1 ATP synthase subunit a [Candidatus Xenobia bacterium]|nr:FoF1 ATP synthase subunit a [Candidatus Xenobia bacterium]